MQVRRDQREQPVEESKISSGRTHNLQQASGAAGPREEPWLGWKIGSPGRVEGGQRRECEAEFGRIL